MGQLTTENIGSVACETVEASLRGRAVVVPGLLNRSLLWFAGLLPASSKAEIIGTRWRAAQGKIHG
jgi:hypothetical protein